MAGNKVLVTGGAGYIGSHVVRQLGEAGYEVVVYDNLSTGCPESVLYGELIVGDLADVDRLELVFSQHEFTAVLHFAASLSVPESVAYPLDYYANNTRNTLNLLRCCQKFNVKQLVFSSTAAVYGEPKQVPVKEDAPTEPINPYGRSKLMSEWMIRDYAAASDLRYVILRYFNVAGADPEGRLGQQAEKAEHLIRVACDVALGRKPELEIFGTDFPTPDGTGVRDYIHVEDLAAAHLAALRYLAQGQPSQVLNCGYGQGFSVRQVVDRMGRIAGVDLPVREVARRAGDPAYVTACAEKIRTILDWSPRFDDLDVILQTALDWERSRQASVENRSVSVGCLAQ
jgi:UDP-glucose 4-epimerase